MSRAVPLTTRRRIVRHLVAAVLLALTATVALASSYAEIHGQAQRMRTTLAPSVQDVASTRVTLLQSWQEAARGGDEGRGYRTELAVARRTLARVAGRQIGGADGAEDLRTINDNVLGAYEESLDDEYGRFANDPDFAELRGAVHLDARASLLGDGTGLIPRIDAFQDRQLRTVGDEVDGGPARFVGWAVAELALLGLGCVLVSAHCLLRRRCGRSWNVPLDAALLLTVVLAVLPLYWARDTADALHEARRELTVMDAQVRAAAGPVGLGQARKDVTEHAADVRAGIDATGSNAARGGWIALGAALTLVLPAGALGHRLWRDYEGGLR